MSKHASIQSGTVVGRIATYTDHSDIKKHGLKGRKQLVVVRGVIVDPTTGSANALVEPCNSFGHGSGGKMLVLSISSLDFVPIDR